MLSLILGQMCAYKPGMKYQKLEQNQTLNFWFTSYDNFKFVTVYSICTADQQSH